MITQILLYLKVCHPIRFLIIINLERRSNMSLSANEELLNSAKKGNQPFDFPRSKVRGLLRVDFDGSSS
jgi:hypothetical protein